MQRAAVFLVGSRRAVSSNSSIRLASPRRTQRRAGRSGRRSLAVERAALVLLERPRPHAEPREDLFGFVLGNAHRGARGVPRRGGRRHLAVDARVEAAIRAA